MSTPISEQIISVVMARLEAIKVADGYSFDVAEVVRPGRKGEEAKYRAKGIQVIQTANTRFPGMDVPSAIPRIAYLLDLQIKCFDRPADEATARGQVENEMHAAVVAAITDAANWQTMSGNAVISELGDCEPLDPDEGEFVGCAVRCLVYYRVRENDPSSL